jgi:hypothetical protein
MDLLGKALQMIYVDYETVTMQVMVRQKKFEDLEAIQCCIDCLSECVANRHVGVPSCWLKRTAQQTIEGVCKAFSRQPPMKRIVDHLQVEWKSWEQVFSPWGSQRLLCIVGSCMGSTDGRLGEDEVVAAVAVADGSEG